MAAGAGANRARRVGGLRRVAIYGSTAIYGNYAECEGASVVGG